MIIKTVKLNAAAVIELKGDLTSLSKDVEFGDTLRRLLLEGKKNIVVDLKKTGYLNSSGLGMLVGGYTTVKNAGGELRLANPTDKIESLLVITKLISVFATYASVEEAVKSFE